MGEIVGPHDRGGNVTFRWMAPLPAGPPALRPFESARLGPLTLRNRIVKAATFEGRTPRGVVTDDLVEFHRRVAAGGAALTTVAYCAVSPDGRVNRHGLVMDDEVVPGLRKLTDAVHAEGAAAAAQLGHAGLVANARSNRAPALAPSRRFSHVSMTLVKGATTAQLARVVEDFRRSARVAVESGFDALEVHLGHGYLLSSFLSPNLNKRTDRYGGDLEGRSRFPREVVRAVREEVGDRVAVLAKLNMADGVAGGLWLDEAVEVAGLLEADGCLDAIELTGGSSLQNPMYLFRGEAPIHEMAAVFPQPMRMGFKLFGRRFLRSYPFEEAYFLPYARQFRAALSMPVVLLGGINRRDTIEAAMAEGFPFVAMGRALLREPDLVRKLEAGQPEGLCVHCNKCMPTIYRGTHCVLVPESRIR